MNLIGSEGIRLDREGIYFWHLFLFFGPVHLLCGPCFHRSGRDLHCYMRWMLFGPWWFFFDLSQGRGNLDSATRCVQEVVAGEIRILKQHKRKKLWRSQRGEAYIWNQMDAGSWEAHWRERKVRNWNQMIARSCWEMRGEAYIETTWRYEDAQGHRAGGIRFRGKMHARRCWKKRWNM